MGAERTDKHFISGLPDNVKRELQRRSNKEALLRLSVQSLVLIVSTLIIAVGLPGWWLMLPLQGLVIVFLFTLEHEATHMTPFAHERLNECVGHVCGFLILLPFTWFRYFHLAHHRYTNDPERDPELLAGGKPEGWASFCWHVSGIPYWVGMARQTLLLAFGSGLADYVPRSAHAKVILEARVFLLGYGIAVLSLFWTSALIWIWVIPCLLGQPFLRLYLLAEHGRCPKVADMFLNTRTTISNRVVRWLAWNMPYHAEHHAMPNVPFHQLPKLHVYTRQHLQFLSPSYTKFHKENAPNLRD